MFFFSLQKVQWISYTGRCTHECILQHHNICVTEKTLINNFNNIHVLQSVRFKMKFFKSQQRPQPLRFIIAFKMGNWEKQKNYVAIQKL